MPTGHASRVLGRDVHIWTICPRASEDVVAQFKRMLVSEETERASRFRFSHLHDSFVISRGVLRCLLGRYLDQDPASIGLVYGIKGKPALASTGDLQFNLTHSNNMAAIALTTGCQIGIDLEYRRPVADMQAIANHNFCLEEAEEILSLSPNERELAFFNCWTRKEAYIKAVGDGLSCALDSFRVSLKSAAPARIIHIAGDRVAAERWMLHDLRLAPDYTAALAYRDRQRSLSVFSMADLSEFLPI
jgi:4'-phosphopantetheinyl transferase